MTAALAWLTSPLWGTLSWVEAGWLLLTLGILVYLKGHLCDARAQRRVAQDEIERRAATADVWSEVVGLFHQVCFGLVGVYAALSPAPPLDPSRILGTLTVTGLLVAVQITNLVFASYRREARRWITEALRRQHEDRGRRTGAPVPLKGGRRDYDLPADPPSHARRPTRKDR